MNEKELAEIRETLAEARDALGDDPDAMGSKDAWEWMVNDGIPALAAAERMLAYIEAARRGETWRGEA